jgi:flagellar biosynthesis protein FlhF
MSDRDVVFLDTAGRSQRDSVRISELLQFFEVVRPNETHLVLSATASEGVLTQAIERFSPLGFERVIFTKLDEAIGFGVILNCLQKVKARLSYVTTGQDVPHDIRVGESSLLASLVLEGSEGLGRT